jgi:hypothetical protein
MTEVPNFRKERERLREYYELLRPLARALVGYGIYELEIDPNIETFAFDHTTKTIKVSTRLIESLGLDLEEQKFAFLHELIHLLQLLQDPDSYIRSFEIPKREAEEKAKENDEYRSHIEEAWRLFFNIFFDIHDNSIIRYMMPVYQRGGRLENLPKRLYSEKLYRETDYTRLPLSVQFLYYLIRKIMVPDEEVVVSEEVKKRIDRKVHYFGREYESVEKFVREEIADPSKGIKEIMFILEEYMMPIYEELLDEDAKRGNLPNIPKYAGDLDIDGDISEEVIKRIAEEIKESKKTPEQRYKDTLRKHLEEDLKNKGFSDEEIKRIMEIEERSLQLVEDLKEIWNNFVQRSTEIGLGTVTGFTKGAGVSPEDLIRKLPALLTKGSAEIFYRTLPEIVSESIRPKKINLELIVDLSGSMDEEKRKAVQEVAYTINKSLINFYLTGCEAVRGEGIEFPVNIFFRIIGFGDSVVELTQTTEEEKVTRIKKHLPEKDLNEELYRAILKIQQIDLGGTQDALALRDVLESINPEMKRRLEDGDEILVVIEITDGETFTVQESKELVEQLNSLPNVFCRAIQIPGPVYSEKPKGETQEERLKPPEVLPPTGTFKEVWGEKWGKRLTNLNILKETVIAILEDALIRYFHNVQ